MKLMVSLITFITLAFLGSQSVYALDEEALCTGSNMYWNRQRYQCDIVQIGQNVAGVSFRVEVQYPTRIMQEIVVKNTIDAVLQDNINTFINDFNNSAPAGDGEWFLLIDCDVFHFDENIFSVVFHTEIYTGGVHPNYFVETLTFDLEQGGVLGLQDLFIPGSDPLALVVPFVRAELTADLGNDPDIVQGIETGTTPIAENFAAFAVTDDALIFFFPPYQLAPFAAGGFTVRMPIPALSSIWQIGDGATPVVKG